MIEQEREQQRQVLSRKEQELGSAEQGYRQKLEDLSSRLTQLDRGVRNLEASRAETPSAHDKSELMSRIEQLETRLKQQRSLEGEIAEMRLKLDDRDQQLQRVQSPVRAGEAVQALQEELTTVQQQLHRLASSSKTPPPAPVPRRASIGSGKEVRKLRKNG